MRHQDIFLRAHTVTPTKPKARQPPKGPKWPSRVLVFDTESTIDAAQWLTFGAYRLCRLVGRDYVCEEEGLFYDDGIKSQDLRILRQHVATHHAKVGVKRFPPRLTLSLYSRRDFVERVFWRTCRRSGLVVAFNLPFDLSRIAVDWRRARTGGWSLILSYRRSRMSGRLEPHPYRPRVRVTARNSRSAFINLTRPHPDERPREGRFLDLHTLAYALLDDSFTLDRLCRSLGVPGKLKHEPTGRVSSREIAYCLQDVRATTDVLNLLKQEFDRHPLDLAPDQAFSPASIAKAYLDAMGLVPPSEKFKLPDDVLGIAMQAYYGGRAECRIRRTDVPVIHTDCSSQYPTVNARLGNWAVLTARNLTFEDATDEVRAQLASVTLAHAFQPDFWLTLSFFALVRPDDDILPVRTVYNGETRNIGINRLQSETPIWFAGPDIVASILLSGKIPRIEKAIRMVPHGTQRGLTPTTLRGMVDIDPHKHDFFRHVVMQRQERKHTDKALADFLKTLANAGSYGAFVEVTPSVTRRPETLTFFSGTERVQTMSRVRERHGRWYFPPLAALITAGGRLLLAMLERSVGDAGGSYLFCDTDSLCIVAAERERLVPCEGGTYRLRGAPAIRALSARTVRRIADRFRALNPFSVGEDRGSILKVEDVNFDHRGRPRRLFGRAISAKRYVFYQRSGRRLTLVEAKAHGLGYLYPPILRDDSEPHWSVDAWAWMLRGELGLARVRPVWLNRPAMMRVTLSTPVVLDRLNRDNRPFGFLLCPLVDPLIGYPVGVDPDRFTVLAPFTKRADRWIHLLCTNVHDGRQYRMALKQTSALDRVIPQTIESVLRAYLHHPEAKSLAPDGGPCLCDTRGLLQRATVVAGAHVPIGKETDRRWEHGEDLTLLGTSLTVGYLSQRGMIAADPGLRNQILKRGIRATMRLTGLSQHTLERIVRGERVRTRTLGRTVKTG